MAKISELISSFFVWFLKWNYTITKMNLQIDKKQKTASLELELEGEKEPISIKVGRYEIAQEAGNTVVKLSGIQTSRAWITVLAKMWELKGGTVPIPKEAEPIVQVLL